MNTGNPFDLTNNGTNMFIDPAAAEVADNTEVASVRTTVVSASTEVVPVIPAQPSEDTPDTVVPQTGTETSFEETPAEVAPAEKPAAASGKKAKAESAADKTKAEHEAAEADRKAKWDAEQAEKKAKEQEKIDAINAMSNADVIAASTAQIETDTERLTQRNMKVCVTEHIQALCKADIEFARRVAHPRKNMFNCFQYINGKALEFAKQEMENKNETPQRVQGMKAIGLDVPDGMCYQWAEEYFNDPNAEIDKAKDEKFVPKPYTGPKKKTTPKKAATSTKKSEQPAAETSATPVEEPKAVAPVSDQLSLFEEVS